MKIAVTGHRPHKLGNDYAGTSELIYNIKYEIEQIFDTYIPTHLITGMALGIDTVFALLAIQHEIPFTAAIPFIGQEKMWPAQSQENYRKIISHPLCEKVIISEGGYTAYKMQVRNEWMVNRCDILIAVWDGTEGGTANCVKYAMTRPCSIIRINPAVLPIKQLIVK